jgi:hypothetical protein
MDRFPIQIDSGDHRQRMPQLEAHENPVLKGGTQFILTFPQRSAESKHPFALGNSPGE